MNRLITTLLMLAVAACSFGQALTIPVYEETPGGTRKWVGLSQPLPVRDMGAASSAAFIGPLPTPTIAMATTVAGATASFTAVADRLYVMIQNHDTATSLWVAPAATATMSQGIEVLPQSHILRPWGSTVPVSYIASLAISVTIEQGVLP